MKTLKIFSFIFALFVSAIAGASDIRWNQLVQYAEIHGERLDSPVGTYSVLTKEIPIQPAGSKHIDYFSAVGGEHDSGFFTSHVEAVSETWKVLPNGNWHIDQWLMSLSTDLERSRVLHYEMIQTADRIVLEHNPILVTEEGAQEALNKLLESWYQHLQL